MLGRKFAADYPGEHPREVAFIALTWASKQLPGQPAPKQRPSRDPNRMELLMIAHLVVSADGPMKEDGQLVEILRDGKGKVRDLYHLPATVKGGQSLFLMLFVLGFQHPQLSNYEIGRLLQDLRGPA